LHVSPGPQQSPLHFFLPSGQNLSQVLSLNQRVSQYSPLAPVNVLDPLQHFPLHSTLLEQMQPWGASLLVLPQV
jgi:hypothetical protein